MKVSDHTKRVFWHIDASVLHIVRPVLQVVSLDEAIALAILENHANEKEEGRP